MKRPGRRHGVARFAAGLVLAAASIGSAGCGKEGPPLPPLRLVPGPATEISARRTGDRIELRFQLPTRNQNGPGPVDLAKIEIFAVTVGPGATTPANRDLLVRDRLVGAIEVRPAPAEGEPAAADAAEKRPGPGDPAVFVEQLTADLRKPGVVAESGTPTEAAAAAAKAAPSGAPSGQPTAPDASASASPSATYPVRVYALRGVTRGGRPGPPAPRVAVPLLDPAAVPARLDVEYTERAYVITWLAAVADAGAAPVAFNVYRKDGGAPLNGEPIRGSSFEQGPVRFGETQCFVVTAVTTVQNVRIESAASPEACIEARDTFPPAPPAGLTAVAGPEGVSLTWTANTEEDLAGYVVLRGEEGSETLQALTPAPIRDTNYRDTTATPGVTYVYALVAVDRSTPPNTSSQSARERATAR